MLQHYIVAIGTFVLLSVIWVAVQRAWKRSFADVDRDPDALAARPSCFGCARAHDCAEEARTVACESQEEMR